jgi:hypothetical protein
MVPPFIVKVLPLLETATPTPKLEMVPSFIVKVPPSLTPSSIPRIFPCNVMLLSRIREVPKPTEKSQPTASDARLMIRFTPSPLSVMVILSSGKI